MSMNYSTKPVKIMKTTFLKIVLIVLIFLAILFLGFLFWQNNQKDENVIPLVLDYKNLTYTIENRDIKLVNGYSEIEFDPGASDTKIITRYFGNEAFGDLNNDGLGDVAFLLTQQIGGTGTFYYLAGALKTSTEYQPINPIYLGDRIAPQTTQISNGSITVNYADRNPGEPMSTTPSMGVSKYFKVESGILVKQTPLTVFGSVVTLKIGEQIAFDDGLKIVLRQINDSQCKPGTVCVWAGELSPVFDMLAPISGTGSLSGEVILGTVNNKKVSKNNYTFELKSATQTTATIIVIKQAQSVACTMEAKQCEDGSYVSRTGPNCEFTRCPSALQAPCYIGGCSSEICSAQESIVSSCIYRAEYACYKNATCARQTNGQCGWTQTPVLGACLETVY